MLLIPSVSPSSSTVFIPPASWPPDSCSSVAVIISLSIVVPTSPGLVTPGWDLRRPVHRRVTFVGRAPFSSEPWVVHGFGWALALGPSQLVVSACFVLPSKPTAVQKQIPHRILASHVTPGPPRQLFLLASAKYHFHLQRGHGRRFSSMVPLHGFPAHLNTFGKDTADPEQLFLTLKTKDLHLLCQQFANSPPELCSICPLHHYFVDNRWSYGCK